MQHLKTVTVVVWTSRCIFSFIRDKHAAQTTAASESSGNQSPSLQYLLKGLMTKVLECMQRGSDFTKHHKFVQP